VKCLTAACRFRRPKTTNAC